MGLPKGRTNNPKGRTPGTTTEKTKQWEALGEAIRTRHTERFNRILDELPDEKFIQQYKDVLDFFQPRLARTENKNTNDNETTIRFEFSDSYTPETAPKAGGVSKEQGEI